MRELLERVAADARDWARGRSYAWRLPLLVYLGYAAVRHLLDPLYGSFLFAAATLGVHELGHVVAGPLGPFLGIAAGSFAQLAAPVALALGFIRQRDWFAVAVAGCWLAFSLFNLATYVGDARAEELPLVTVGSGDAEHDWHYLLESVGLLGLDTALAFLLRVAAAGIAAVALAGGGWLLGEMRRTRARDG